VEAILVEDPGEPGPFGAKEVGQGPLLPIPPAVANAVHDALGVRVAEVPITPDKVLEALASPSRRCGPEAFPAVPWPAPLVVPPPWEGGDGTAVNEPKRRKPAPPAGVKP
jgi:4-hydroxybenzoyl-CoA reductase subunit alpha